MELNESLLKHPNYAEKVCGVLLNTLFAFIILVLITSFITTVYYNLSIISGDSMNPTMINGQYVLCEKNPKIEKINRGDIIVFNKSDTEQFVKRVVAVGGDTLKFKKDGNGNTVTLCIQYGSEGEFIPQEESYLGEKMQVSYWTQHSFELFFDLDTPFKVSKNCVFALGDNRNNSLDSRYREVGQVEADAIVSRVCRIVPKGSLEEAYLGIIYGTYFKSTAGNL